MLIKFKKFNLNNQQSNLILLPFPNPWHPTNFNKAKSKPSNSINCTQTPQPLPKRTSKPANNTITQKNGQLSTPLRLRYSKEWKEVQSRWKNILGVITGVSLMQSSSRLLFMTICASKPSTFFVMQIWASLWMV